MSLELAIIGAAINGETLSPQITNSLKYKHWVSVEDFRRCVNCAKNHGKIWLISETPKPSPKLHTYCRCIIQLMQAITAGTATIERIDGADWWLMHKGELSSSYITKEDAILKGWKPSKWPSNFVSGKIKAGGRYYNDDNHLPQISGRIWYEADINYKYGKRNNQRIVWSNDGMIFVTYDHYEIFYEIV